jgi:hypothetical protein
MHIGICSIILLLAFNCSVAQSQMAKKNMPPCKLLSYQINNNSDTINKVDCKNLKQGYWQELVTENEFISITSKEVGTYVDGKKNGVWKSYEGSSLQSIINYIKGSPDGEAKYFEEGFLACIGHFKAITVGKEKELVAVYNPDNGYDTMVLVKKPIGILKHGTWQYFNSDGDIVEERTYYLDEVVEHKVHKGKNLTDKQKILIEQSLPHNTGLVKIPMHKSQKVPIAKQIPKQAEVSH